jgi:hypothetical protein
MTRATSHLTATADRPGPARALTLAAIVTSSTVCEILAGLAWVAGRITWRLGRYYASAVIARLLARGTPAAPTGLPSAADAAARGRRK